MEKNPSQDEEKSIPGRRKNQKNSPKSEKKTQKKPKKKLQKKPIEKR
jgi:hypothetical protein